MDGMRQLQTRRAKGMGSVKVYGPDAYRAVLRWTDELGKSRTRTKVTKTKAEAEQALREFRAEQLGNLERVRPSTVGALVAEWLSSRQGEIGDATLAQYQWAADKITQGLGNARLGIRPSVIDEFISSLDLAPRSRSLIKKVLAMTFEYGVTQRLIESNPTKGTKPVRVDRREVAPWSATDLQMFLIATETDRLGALWFLLGSLGLRRGEALALRWSDFNPDKLTLAITKSRKKAGSRTIEAETKTARSVRTLPVPKTVANVLEAHRARQREELEHLLSLGIRAESEYMFLSEFGRPLDPDNASKAFKRFARAAGLGDRHVHELRHLSASLLLARGVPMPEISRILGHSSSRVTDEVYSHLSVEDLRPALDRVWQS